MSQDRNPRDDQKPGADGSDYLTATRVSSIIDEHQLACDQNTNAESGSRLQLQESLRAAVLRIERVKDDARRVKELRKKTTSA